MAERRNVLQSTSKLKRFVLSKVRSTGRLLGHGVYGVVEELETEGLPVAGKKINEALLNLDHKEYEKVIQKYVVECELLSDLRHPNVVQFLGLCSSEDTSLPVLVMELLMTSLQGLLEGTSSVSLALKSAVLKDVARGLVYLHNHDPVVVHQDLMANNVLIIINSAFVAKISDLVNSRVVVLQSGQLAKMLSEVPERLLYVPPEALCCRPSGDISNSCKSVKFDIFSFGHLALLTITQVFPRDVHLPSSDFNPRNVSPPLHVSELERRRDHMAKLHQQLGQKHPLVRLVVQCLEKDPTHRPSAEKVLQELDGVQTDDPYQHVTKLELIRQIEGKREELAEKMEEIRTRDADIREKEEAIKQRETELKQKEQVIRQNNGIISQFEGVIAQKEKLIETLQARLTEVQERAQGLKAERDRARFEVESLTEREQATALKTEMKTRTLQQQLENLQRELAVQQQLVQAQESEIQANKEQLEAKEQRLAANKRRLDAKQQQILAKDQETEALVMEQKASEQEFAALRRQADSFQQQLTALRHGWQTKDVGAAQRERILSSEEVVAKAAEIAAKDVLLWTMEGMVQTLRREVGLREGQPVQPHLLHPRSRPEQECADIPVKMDKCVQNESCEMEACAREKDNLQKKVDELTSQLYDPKCQRLECVKLRQAISSIKDMGKVTGGEYGMLIERFEALTTIPEGLFGALEEATNTFDAQEMVSMVFKEAFCRCKQTVFQAVNKTLESLFVVGSNGVSREGMENASQGYGQLLHASGLKVNQEEHVDHLTEELRGVLQVQAPMCEHSSVFETVLQNQPSALREVVKLAWEFVTLPNPMIVCEPGTFTEHNHEKEYFYWNPSTPQAPLIYLRPAVYRSYQQSIPTCKAWVANSRTRVD